MKQLLNIRTYIFIVLIAIFLNSCVSTTMPEQTQTPFQTLTQQATPTQTFTPTVEYSERIEFSMLSPDGTKEIQTKDWLTFDILDTRNNMLLWSFSYDRAKFGEGDRYLPEAGYVPFHWSHDGKYIYVYAHQGWDGGVKYFGDVFGAEEGVARFDIDTGIMTYVISERYGGGYTFAISPDEIGIIYVDQQETPLKLRWKSLLSNKEKTLLTFDENIYDAGYFGWSSSMDQLVYTTLEVQNPLEITQEFLFSISVMDLKDLQPQLILQGLERPLNFELWDEQNKVYFSDWENTIWQLDLVSKTINAVGIATPSP